MESVENAFSRLKELLERFNESSGILTVLSGAGISAESGIPTFRGPEGYWRVGSKEYRPEEMATHAMFQMDPWEVWSWYLYRRAVCRRAAPNPGHFGVVSMEKILGDRFRLITQNVDGLHLLAGNTQERTFQIHGNIHFMRCARLCCTELFPMPSSIKDKGINESVTEDEKKKLACPHCMGLSRPHVLWFDEFYDENFFRAESALQWAGRTDLLLVVGTSGATTLPMQVSQIVYKKQDALIVDVNPFENPFRSLAETHANGVVLNGNSGEMIPKIASLLASFTSGSR